MIKKRYNKSVNSSYLFAFIIGLFIIFLTIGFSAFQNDLRINNISADVRIDKDIRVMDVSLSETKEAISTYEEYNVSNITSNISLSKKDSYIIYKVSVYNFGNVLMGIKEININYDSLKVEILNHDLKTKLCEENKCTLGAKKELQVKVSYKEDKYDPLNFTYNIKIDFLFARIYNINYNDIDSTSKPLEIIEGETLILNIPNRIEHILKVFMSNKKLIIDIDYKYQDDLLTIFNVSGNISMFFKLPICKRATVLHTEECTGRYCKGLGYTLDGAKKTTTITYGSFGNTGSIVIGDAFDCDVNGDGIYDSATERFYYVTNMDDNIDVAVLIYYNNVGGGEPNNKVFYSYDAVNENWHGPRDAIKELPTTLQWSNVKLYNTERAITNEYGTNNTKDNHTFPKTFSYAAYAARLLTYQELKKSIDVYIPTWKSGELNDYLFFVENTNFATGVNSVFDGYWLENPRFGLSQYAWFIYAAERRVHSAETKRNDGFGVRPVIEVLISDISY